MKPCAAVLLNIQGERLLVDVAGERRFPKVATSDAEKRQCHRY